MADGVGSADVAGKTCLMRVLWHVASCVMDTGATRAPLHGFAYHRRTTLTGALIYSPRVVSALPPPYSPCATPLRLTPSLRTSYLVTSVLPRNEVIALL